MTVHGVPRLSLKIDLMQYQKNHRYQFSGGSTHTCCVEEAATYCFRYDVIWQMALNSVCNTWRSRVV